MLWYLPGDVLAAPASALCGWKGVNLRRYKGVLLQGRQGCKQECCDEIGQRGRHPRVLAAHESALGLDRCNTSLSLSPLADPSLSLSLPWQIREDATVCINTKKDKPMSQ